MRSFWTLLFSVLIAWGCGGEKKDSTTQNRESPLSPAIEQSSEPAESAEITGITQEQLAALGYLEVTDEAVDPNRVGVVHYDRDRAQPGFNLYCNYNSGHAELIDMDGNTIQRWEPDNSREWAGCKLLPNGDLIGVGVDFSPNDPTVKTDAERRVLRLSWEGEALWKHALWAHHHIDAMPDGNFITLTFKYKSIPDLSKSAKVRIDFSSILSPEGEPIRHRSLFNAFNATPDKVKLERTRIQDKWGQTQMDLIHANTVEWLNKEHLFDRSSIYGPGNVLVTSRRQNVTAIINWDSNLVLWAWGQGEILSPHDATLLDNGNILLLDNGDKGHRPFSRVLEIDPLTDKIVWEYRAENPEDFFTASRGAIQRLPNGNTLITNSNSGQVFEVTHEGEIVWEFLNPHLTPTLHRATMRRLERYPKDYVEAILARHPSDN